MRSGLWRGWAWALAVALALLAVLGPAACGPREGPPPAQPAEVTVSRPLDHDVVEWDEYSGRLQAVESVDVRARVSGFVDETPFQDGSIVQKGQLLFLIDPRPFKAQLEAANAAVQGADAKLTNARQELARLTALRPTNGASEKELQDQQYATRAAEAELLSAQAQARIADLNLSFTRVTAPITGRVSRRLVTPGNLISGGTGNDTLLTNLTSTDPIYHYVEVDEVSVLKYQRLAREKRRISARDEPIPCYLGLQDEQGFPHAGVVDFVDNQIDTQTGTLTGRGVFPNPRRFLTPGMYGRVRIPGSGRYRALLIPDSSIGTDQSQKFVLVVGPDGKVAYKPVKPGPVFEHLRVVEGVAPDDRIIVKGLLRARPGMVVKAIDEPLALPPSLANINDPLAAVTLHNPPAATAPSTTQPATSQPAAPATAPATAPAATQPVALSGTSRKEGAR
jgi:multidrug efflux system membrane fusion protein